MTFITIHSIFFAIAAVLWAYLFESNLRNLQKPYINSWRDTLIILFFGLIGARLGYVIVYLNQFSNLWQILNITNGGLISYTGAIAGAAAMWWVFGSDQSSWRAFLRAGLLAWGVGRFGNYFWGDTPGINGFSPALFESLICFVLYLLPVDEINLIVLYLLGRFVGDLWRIDSSFYGVSLSMWGAMIGIFLLSNNRTYKIFTSALLLSLIAANTFTTTKNLEWYFIRLTPSTFIPALILLTVVLSMFKKNKLVFDLIFAGALGNLILLLRFGYVPDHLPIFGWYTNLQDLLLLSGITLALFSPKTKKPR